MDNNNVQPDTATKAAVPRKGDQSTAIVGELRQHIHRAGFTIFQDLARSKEREIMCHHSIARQGVRKVNYSQEENTLPQYSAGRLQCEYHRFHWRRQQESTSHEDNGDKLETCKDSQMTSVLERSSAFNVPEQA